MSTPSKELEEAAERIAKNFCNYFISITDYERKHFGAKVSEFALAELQSLTSRMGNEDAKRLEKTTPVEKEIKPREMTEDERHNIRFTIQVPANQKNRENAMLFVKDAKIILDRLFNGKKSIVVYTLYFCAHEIADEAMQPTEGRKGE